MEGVIRTGSKKTFLVGTKAIRRPRDASTNKTTAKVLRALRLDLGWVFCVM
jgi:hypothetical protein